MLKTSQYLTLMINITPIHAFNDNYIWAITNEQNNQLILVDPGQIAPCLHFINENNLVLTAVLITHHHNDHVGAINELTKHASFEVYGPATEEIPHIKHKLVENDVVNFDDFGLTFKVFDVPGHTAGHIVYYSKENNVLFSGDTLFSGGCGRLFEGTAAQMHNSLSKLRQLPAATKVYCAHEYTLANLYFALAVEPENVEVLTYFNHVNYLRDNNQATIPTTIEQELKINPFLRANEASVKVSAELHSGDKLNNEIAVFAAVRRWKDNF